MSSEADNVDWSFVFLQISDDNIEAALAMVSVDEGLGCS